MKAMSLVLDQRWLIFWFISLYCQWEMGAAHGETISPTAAAPVEVGLGHCPLNLSYLDSHPWMIKKCLGPDKSNCCEGIMDFVRIFLFSWLHATRSFLLPDNHTSSVCLNALQRRLEAQGIAGTVLESCRLLPSNLTSAVGSCNKIENLSSFERAVNPSGMQQNCNGSASAQFECHKCVRAMAIALRQLQEGGSQGESSCVLFVLMYVGGGINSYEELGVNAAYCILGAQNLAALASSTSSPIGGADRKRNKMVFKVVLGIAISVVILLSLLGFFAWLEWRRLYRAGGWRRRNLFQKQAKMLRESVNASTGLAFFGLSEIKASTRNFSASNVNGEGGFSTVYKGTLPDGSEIAVKRFKDSTTKGDADFRHEVQVISSVRHRNLLPLRGYSIGRNEEGLQEQLLVYDFMENGSLADYLFRSNKPCLTWPQRYKIAVGIARGLAYLHQDAKPAIIHRDIKAANVLLDAHLNPLLADFGLARFKQDTDKTHYTTRAVGTMGYVAPEYALYGHLTDKSDVFSLGILLLELLTGRKALDPSSPNLELILISDWACELIRMGKLREVIDSRILDSGPLDIMERVILLALQCAHPKVASRPSISQVLAILEAVDRPLPEIISVATVETESSGRRPEADWLLSPDVEGRISYRSVTVGNNISVGSYAVGR